MMPVIDTLEKQIKDHVMIELLDHIHMGMVGKVFLSPRQIAQTRGNIIRQIAAGI